MRRRLFANSTVDEDVLKEAVDMQGVVKIGTVGEERFVVSEQHLIDFAHDGMPGILCTPWLIWFLEHAARNAMLPLLEPGESTVGVVVNVEHIAATPLGEQVVCRARVIYAEGPLISFQFEAHDEHEKIAAGTHKLRVIHAARLAEKVVGKLRQHKS
jgi:fluoroacetyl-CoA thioesterase